MSTEQELVTFEDVKKKKYVLMIFPDGMIGVYKPSSDALIQSIKNVQADTFSEGKVLALVPCHLTEEEFLKLDGRHEEIEVLQ